MANGQAIALMSFKTGLSGTTESIAYLHRDALGSVEAVTDQTGQVVARMSFDAFGQRRDPETLQTPEAPLPVATDRDYTYRGYTGQEQLDAVNLIHMNGRVYDPVVGRFTSADPLVQAPYSGQSLNRYTYVFNNPLSAVDPSGFDGFGIVFSAPTGNIGAMQAYNQVSRVRSSTTDIAKFKATGLELTAVDGAGAVLNGVTGFSELAAGTDLVVSAPPAGKAFGVLLEADSAVSIAGAIVDGKQTAADFAAFQNGTIPENVTVELLGDDGSVAFEFITTTEALAAFYAKHPVDLGLLILRYKLQKDLEALKKKIDSGLPGPGIGGNSGSSSGAGSHTGVPITVTNPNLTIPPDGQTKSTFCTVGDDPNNCAQ